MTEQTGRRFPPPWRAVELEEAFRIEDANGFPVSYVYFTADPERRSSTGRMSKDEARRIATGIVKRVSPNITRLEDVSLQGLLNNAVAFHEAGARAYAEGPCRINPSRADVFLGAPSVVNYVFAIELYLKLILLIKNGCHNNQHDLWKLYKALPAELQQAINETYHSLFGPFGHTVGEKLKKASNDFVEWRYVHAHELLTSDTEALARIGSALHKTVQELAPQLVSVFEAGGSGAEAPE